ncbi:sugar transferase [Clostridium sp. D2Q-11]|uniref:Sugar transferase n=1 Tax=Anaeromonas frigoriresistens TaxID=2683708 RepID=A0A942V157_9FIRM|nr:sugar transferase [Anaeromonas frigoriresistens]MBS4539277.1 sugar transferase [Anaeromonas frigoriresistens]
MKPYLIIKRILDFFCACILVIVASPIMGLAAVAIKLESEGPILFKQDRPGKSGNIFKVNKFRTMKIEVEKNGKMLSDMERMTKVGSILRKSSIDELPQLINIIRGEMSFIGPRPLLVQYLDHYSREQMRRHEVTPGISGWAQVNGRNTISWEQKFEYDVWYVDNISFLLDIKIIRMTIVNVLNRKDINNSEDNTMSYFTNNNNKEEYTSRTSDLKCQN